MPSARGLTVHVTDRRGQNLPEFGVQHLRQRANGEKVSAYVQSITGLQFQVSVAPSIPFAYHDRSNKDNVLESTRINRRSSHLGGPIHPPRAGSEERLIDKKYHSTRTQSKLTLSSPIRWEKPYTSTPAFSFLASLYLDGRSRPERRVIVYTDPNDPDFNAPNGKVSFKHRWMQAKDGTTKEHAWVFRENAIENVFNGLSIAGGQSKSKDCDEDTMVEAMQSSELRLNDAHESERSKVGQMIVEIRRVVLGRKFYDQHYRSKHWEGKDEDIKMDEVKGDVTHATGLTYKSTIAPLPLRVVDYWDYKPEEGLWATFQFFYRSAEQLQKFGFHGLQPKSRGLYQHQRSLDNRMVNLTPLSILNPSSPNPKIVKTSNESYEEKVKKRAGPSLPSEKNLIMLPAPESNPPKASFLPKRLPPLPLHPPGFAPIAAFLPTPKPQSLLSRRSSSPPQADTLTTSNIAKLNASTKDAYRQLLKPQTSDIGEEEDADDELNTESDLETHAGDDEFEYVADPKRDEAYEDLRERLGKVDIRKRTRGQVDDAAAEADEDCSVGMGSAADLTDGGAWLVPEEVKEQVHGGKKAKI